MAKRNAAQEVRPTDEKQSGRRTFYQSLHLMPLGWGMLLGLLLIALSIPLGNGRELLSQTRSAQEVWDGLRIDGVKVPENEQVPIPQILAGRAGDAANLLAVMRRYEKQAVQERATLEQARVALQKATTPAQTKQANDALQAAMSGAIDALYAQAEVSEEDKENVLQVVDSFNDHGRKLRVRARDYDRAMQKALDTYNDIPTRALFSQPELYGLE